MRKIVLFIVVLCLFSYLETFSQENILHKSSNYSPSSSVMLNPATIVDSKTLTDATFLGVSGQINNNAIKAINFDILQVNFAEELNTSNTSKHAKVNSEITLLALNFNIEKHAIGFGIRGRAFGNISNINSSFTSQLINGIQQNTPTSVENLNNFSVGGLAWGELSLSYAVIIKQRKKELYQLGITAKYIMGGSGLYGGIDELSYSNINNTLIAVSNFRGTVKYNASPSILNSGLGVDLGFVFKKTFDPIDRYVPYKKNGSCVKSEYNYKIGISILDLGFVNFKSTGSQYFSIDQNVPLNWSPTKDLNSLKTSFNTSTLGSSFMLLLPTALSFQFDKNLNQNVYFNTTVIQDLGFLFENVPRRTNSLYLSTRYEVDYFEAGLSFSLRDYTYPAVGFSIRLGNNLTFGSDDLAGLLNIRAPYAMSAYVSFKTSKLWRRSCKIRKIKSPFQIFSNTMCTGFTPIRAKRKKDKSKN